LLIQLADRDIISHETVLERFKEIPRVEKMRLKREDKARGKETLPDKASPFHNPNHKKDLEKIEKQAEVSQKNKPEQSQKPSNENGRPPGKIDEVVRKKRVDTPKSRPGLADLIVWSNKAYDQISDKFNKAFLSIKNKKNMRSLTKAEVSDLEKMKMDVLLNIKPLSEIKDEDFKNTLYGNKKMPEFFKRHLEENKITTEYMTMEEYKRQAIASYIDYVLSKN